MNATQKDGQEKAQAKTQDQEKAATETSAMTLDDLIKRLEELKAKHGGGALVFHDWDDVYDQPGDASDYAEFGQPYPHDDKRSHLRGVLLG